MISLDALGQLNSSESPIEPTHMPWQGPGAELADVPHGGSTSISDGSCGSDRVVSNRARKITNIIVKIPKLTLTTRLMTPAIAMTVAGSCAIGTAAAGTTGSVPAATASRAHTTHSPRAKTATTKPMDPNGIDTIVREYESGAFHTGEAMDWRTIAIFPHRLHKTGYCPPNDPNNASDRSVEFDNTVVKGIREVSCMNYNGKPIVSYIYLKDIIAPAPALLSMDLRPLLHSIGSMAAASVGITAVGTVSRVAASRDTSTRTVELDVFYDRVSGNAGAGSARYPKELKFIKVNNTEKVVKVWY